MLCVVVFVFNVNVCCLLFVFLAVLLLVVVSLFVVWWLLVVGCGLANDAWCELCDVLLFHFVVIVVVVCVLSVVSS